MGEKYILAIAIDKYSSKSFPSLHNAKNDAKRLINILTAKYGFKLIREPLFDGHATRRNILEALNELMSFLTKDDSLIIYHAGHGTIHPKTGKGYWIPNEAAHTVGDWILHSEIIDYLEGCDAKHLCLITDSCFSGSFFSKTRGIDDIKNHYARLSEIKSRWFLTSGREEKVSDGKAGKGSPFANSLIDFFEKNIKKYVSVSELSIHVEEITSRSANQTPRWGSILSLGDEGGQLVFELKSSIIHPPAKGKRSWEDNLALFVEAKLSRPEWPYISKMNPETKSLGVWCQEQREFKRKGKLSKDREEKLLKAGFIFDPTIEKFHKGFVKFLAFMYKTGLNDVPGRLMAQYQSENSWHRVQQRWYAKAPCNPDNPNAYPQYRYNILLKNGIPIEATIRAEAWKQFELDLAKFYETNERFVTIPSQSDKNIEIANLGQSLNDWMVRWKGGHLSEERIKFLEQYVDKDYELNKQKRSFEVQILDYLKFRREFPNEKPPKGLSKKRNDIKDILDWKAQVNHRIQNGKSPIHKWKIERLNEIDFPWSKKAHSKKQENQISPGLFD
jgi:Caspase domain